MLIDRVDTLLQALEESQLLSAAQLEECRSTQASFADTRALARHLLQRDWLTAYQVNHVLQGKAGELFLDKYVLMERIGQGGMGQVFRAKHRIMNRVVALKIIRPERLASPELVSRFRREIQLAGKLAHPNIAIAYDAAEQHGIHFLVMEFVEGTDLAHYVEKNGRRPVPQACEWVRQVALGLQHAHERGMIHRDIKPANLLLAVKDNVVKVLDMGLARLSQGIDADLTAAGLTQEGTVMGTPDYMAPEQAEESTGVDIRADIYSLGCTLYYLLAGRVPFPGGTLAQKLRKHALAEPEPLEAQRDDVPPGVSAVVRKMMAKRPEDRYPTPGEVAAALEPLCRAGPVAAVPVAAVAAPVPVVAAVPPARPVAVPLSQESIAALAQPLAVPVALAPHPYPSPPEGERGRGEGDEAPQAAETVPPSVHDSVPSVTVLPSAGALARARRAWRRFGRRGQIIVGGGAGVLLALLIVLLWPRSQKPADLAAPETVLGRLNVDQVPPEDRAIVQRGGLKDLVVAVLGEHRVRLTSGGNCMALSPDRKKVAVADGNAIKVVDTHSLRLDYELAKHTSTVYGLAFSANGKYLVSGGNDKAVCLWDAGSGNLVRELPGAHNGAVLAVALSPDGKQVLSAGDDAKVNVWSAATGERLRTFAEHKTPVRALVVSPDGRLACSAGGTQQDGKDADRDVRVWEVATANPDRVLTGHRGYVNRLEISPDGKRLLAGTDKSEVPVWDLAAGSLQPQSLVVDNNGNVTTNGTFVGDDRVVTWASNGVLKPWVPNGRGGLQELDQLPFRANTGSGLAWVRDVPRENRPDADKGDGLLFVADGTLHVVNLERKKEWREPLGHTQPARQLTFLDDGDWLVSAGDDRAVRFWNLAGLYDPATGWPREGRPTLKIPSSNGNQTFRAAAVSRDGNLVLTVLNTDNYAQVWLLENNKWVPVRRLEVKGGAGGDALLTVALKEDGTRALTAGTDKVLRLWNVERGTELKKIDGLSNPCGQVGYFPDGRAYSWDGNELRLWDGLGDAEKPQSVAMSAGGSALALSPGRDVALVGRGDGHIERLTEFAKGKPLRLELDRYQQGAISALSLSPDRKLLLAGSADPWLALWELTKDPIPKPQRYDVRGAPLAVTFAPDGRHVALANPDGTIYLLRLPMGQ